MRVAMTAAFVRLRASSAPGEIRMPRACRVRIVAICTARLCIAVGTSRALAHGTMILPESRIHRCAFDGGIENHQDPACRAAIDLGGKQPNRTPTTGAIRTYPTGIGSYGPGTNVHGTNGLLYQCRPFPYSGWCNQAPPYHAPGTGWNWQDAWVRM
jgi:hypothetical protein